MKKVLTGLVFSMLTIMLLPAILFASEEGAAAGLSASWIALATGGLMGIAALSGTMAMGKTISTALEGIGRNPGSADKMFVPMIIGLALIESVVLYAFIIAIFLNGHIG
ncbi:ATP synthase F0 subunit C [Thermodesulfobacteriota bacterium]